MTDEFWSGKLLINDIYESLVSLALSEVLKRDQLRETGKYLPRTEMITSLLSPKHSPIPTGEDKRFGMERLQQHWSYLPPNNPSPRNCSR